MVNILYLDDEKANLDVFRICFLSEYKVYTAQDVKEAESILEQEVIAVLISDQRMPDEKGTDFIYRMKQKFPDTVYILLSGYLDFEVAKDAINKGLVYKFLSKPWEEDNMMLDLKLAVDQYFLKKENKELLSELTKKMVNFNICMKN
jgi:DNA-binding NtrC family response regulator